jgi:hypothetical protein
MKRAPTVAVVVVLGLAAAWFLRRESADDADLARGESPALLLDRVWVDSKPEKYTDYTQAMLVLGNAPIGIFQKASAYQATMEVFEHRQREGKLGVHFPQSGKKREIRFRVRECNDLPPFDLCLDLSANPWGGPKRYFGLADPDEEQDQLGSLRDRLEAEVRARTAGSTDRPAR